MKNFLLSAILFLFTLNVLAQQKPNILLIYTDDQAQWATGVSGNEQAHTPNIDRLARGGAYLQNSFVTTPVCSPARASLLTGRYASEFNIHDFIPPVGHTLYQPEEDIGLNPKSTTFAEVLLDRGYTTGLVGKFHVGASTIEPTRKHNPTDHGFDYFMGLTGGGASPIDPRLEKNGKIKEFEGLTTDILTDHAIEFLKRNEDKSFLLSVNYRAPHGRWLPVAQEDWEPYKDLDPKLPNPNYPNLDVERAKQMMREYLASASGVDRNVGRLLHTLDMLKIADNTIVIFTSDHGFNMGHNGIYHKGNGIWLTKAPPSSSNIEENSRPNLYDQSLRVPAIVRWPKVVKPNTVISETVSSLDWFPTILEMAGAKVPNGKIVRGHSIVPLLKGKKEKDWDNSFYSEYTMINYSQAYLRSYRTPNWKLIKDYKNPKRDELYNIAKDPQENINMIHDSRDEIKNIIKELEQKIEDKMHDIGDVLLDTLSNR